MLVQQWASPHNKKWFYPLIMFFLSSTPSLVCAWQVVRTKCLPYWSPPYFLRQNLSLNLKLSNLDRAAFLTNLQDCSVSTNPGMTDVNCPIWRFKYFSFAFYFIYIAFSFILHPYCSFPSPPTWCSGPEISFSVLHSKNLTHWELWEIVSALAAWFFIIY